MIKRIIIYSLLLLLTLIIGTSAFLVTTEKGLQITANIVIKLVPGQLQIGKISGRLIQSIHISQLNYKDKTTHLHIDQSTLKWKASKLLSGQLFITQLHVETFQLKTLSQPTKKQPSQKNESQHFPLSIIANDVIFNNVSIQKDNNSPTVIENIQLNASTKKDKINIQKLHIKNEFQQANVHGSIQVNFPFNINIHANITSDIPGYQPMSLHAEITGNIKDVLQLNLNVNKPFTAWLNAKVEHADQLGPINITGEWKDLILPIGKENNIASHSGQINIHGTLRNYQCQLNTDLYGINIPKTQLQLSGKGNSRSIHFSTLNAKLLEGELKGNLDFYWRPTISWNSQINAININPGLKWPDWVGHINFTLASKGQWDKKLKSFEIQFNNFHGNLHKHPVKGYFQAKYENDELNIAKSYLSIGDDFFRINGMLGTLWNFNWTIKAPNISEAFPHSSGAIQGQGKITGQNKTPYIKGFINLRDVLIKNTYYFKQLNTLIDINFKPKGISSVTMTGNEILLDKLLINQLEIDLTGHTHHHKLEAHIETKNEKLHAIIAGQLKGTIWTGEFVKLHLQTNRDWNLNHTIPLMLKDDKIKIHKFCWSSQQSKMCGHFNWQKDQLFDLAFNANDIPTDLLSTFLPSQVQLQSKFNMNSIIKGDSTHAIHGYANLDSPGGKIIYQNNEKKSVPIGKIQFHNKLDNKGLTSTLKINNLTATPVNYKLQLPGYKGDGFPHYDQELQGFATVDIQHLNLLPLFIPQIYNTDGRLNAKINIGGTYGQPSIEGKVNIENGQVSIDRLDITLKKINLSTLLQKNGEIQLNGKLESRGHLLNLNGSTSLKNKFQTASLKISGKNVLVINSEEYQAFASPDLTFNYEKPKLTIAGNIDIPKASLTPKDFTMITTLPNTVIITDAEGVVSKAPISVYSDINISIGNNVNLTAIGLNAQLAGQLSIKSAPQTVTTATGALNIIKGNYHAYGEKLIIDQGSLMFTGGPITNPGLNIRAIKNISRTAGAGPISGQNNSSSRSFTRVYSSNLKVGVKLLGTLNQPHLVLFSEPPGLSNTNILAYLVLGRSSDQANDQQAQLLFKAANTLGFGDSNMTEDIQQKFGLTDFGVGTTQTKDQNGDTKDHTTLTIGKQISPRLNINYAIGLMTPINILRIQFSITKHITLQSETSTRDTGADLLYSLETD